ncbi:hypothetical protein C1C98_06620 [Pseudomonas ogarae]|uniref:DUF1534 domain-containing protein n=1 Tax=Pseudomonas ogarae (strain DSM 112162 / CECT 30235 / F113) TaxID=1114970 RepID=A0ABM6QV20_PSEO1|nr:hypothetical protein C1C98_06620 [Pseudomonas ogarae]
MFQPLRLLGTAARRLAKHAPGGKKNLWEQGLPAMRPARSFRDSGAFIAGKPCSHKYIVSP